MKSEPFVSHKIRVIRVIPRPIKQSIMREIRAIRVQ